METQPPLSLPHLKRVSRIKHQILVKYLPAWQRILGSAHSKLAYIDCYAGPGEYEFQGKQVVGSPIIALESGKDFLRTSPSSELVLVFVENDRQARESLEAALKSHGPLPARLSADVLDEDAKDFMQELLRDVRNMVPTFVMVDPYGHPLTIPIINDILRQPRAEALITFMYYRINMDVANPKAQARVDQMFGHVDWRRENFLRLRGYRREIAFLEQIKAKYKLPFKLRFDPEDRVPSSRTKYYLIHASNHAKAVLLMKEVMSPLGDEDGIFDYSGREQGGLFSAVPRDDELERVLRDRYACTEISFDALREDTWRLPFTEKRYRSVIKTLRARGLAEIQPVTSKTERGLSGHDIVHILKKKPKGTHGMRKTP